MCTFAEQTSEFIFVDRIVLYVVLICEVGVIVYSFSQSDMMCIFIELSNVVESYNIPEWVTVK